LCDEQTHRQNILVTGASRGLGREIALRFAREGAAGLSLVARHIAIINVTSDAGQVGYPGWGAYGISKFGLEGMLQTWASELEDAIVRVNWVDPGNMKTAMQRAAEPEEDPTAWANPADVTDAFFFLASDESKDVSGKRFQAQKDWKADLIAGTAPSAL
jgi:NAD(P)-dependent dehydrogenase (short-subunit alcohol dehydrogenase family)